MSDMKIYNSQPRISRLVSSIILVCGCAGLFAAEPQFTGSASAPSEPLSLWYRQPAGQWLEALPIGNGRIGAMVYGCVNQEWLQLNEDTLWGGGPYDPVNPQAKAALPQVRQLVFEGKYREAGNLINQKVIARPSSEMPYETAGYLVLDCTNSTTPALATAENYRRDLNLNTAVAGVEYTANGVHFTREVFASPADQVIVVHLTADKKGAINFTAGYKLATPPRGSSQNGTVETESGNTLVV
ncbi:MAG TPA: glycoside hydrolase family 95 protein, partial [Verrucomicrobiae bacterium]|nr:glycoside hydrolase family 95 protein [Verrucomicrobiae bacterium]